MTNSIKFYETKGSIPVIKPVFDVLPFAISWRDENKKVLGTNTFHENFCGITFNEGIGKDVYDFGDILSWDKAVADELYLAVSKTILYNKTQIISTKINSKNNRIHSYIIFYIPIAAAAQVKWLGIGGDIENFSLGNTGVGEIFLSTKNLSDAIEVLGKIASNKTLINVTQNLNNFNKEKITNRELDCIKLLKEGLSSKQIASILHISKRTVEQHIDTAKNKFSCRNSVELIHKCFKNGIL